MKALIVVSAIFALWLDVSCGSDDQETRLLRTPAQVAMDSVPLYDRPHFVSYHISIALNERQRTDVTFLPVLDTIPSEKREAFQKIPTPPNFSANLLDWTELELVPSKNGHKNDSFKSSIHTMIVCFPSGCVDPNDAGHLCCPF